MSLDENINEEEKRDEENDNDDKQSKPQNQEQKTKEKDEKNEEMSIDNTLHSVFGASKTSADILVQEYGKYFGLNTVCFRGGCLTGENHTGTELHGFLSFLVKTIIRLKLFL